MVSERNVLEDVVFHEPSPTDLLLLASSSSLEDMTTELNIEVVYSRWSREKKQQLSSVANSSDEGGGDDGRRRQRGCKTASPKVKAKATAVSSRSEESPATGTSSVTTIKTKKKIKIGSSQVISLSKKKKVLKQLLLSPDSSTATHAAALSELSSSLSGTMLMRECKVRARLLAIPPQILPTSASTNEEATAGGVNGSNKPLLPFQIAKSLQRRGLPRVCVKYAEIVPPRREVVVELLQNGADKTHVAPPTPGKKRAPAKAAKAERKAPQVGNGGRGMDYFRSGGALLDALIPLRPDYLGQNNPFHLGNTETLRKARNLLCNRQDSCPNIPTILFL